MSVGMVAAAAVALAVTTASSSVTRTFVFFISVSSVRPLDAGLGGFRMGGFGGSLGSGGRQSKSSRVEVTDLCGWRSLARDGETT